MLGHGSSVLGETKIELTFVHDKELDRLWTCHNSVE